MSLAARFVWLSCISVVTAHNWLTSPSRANAGNNFNGWTSPPCPQKGDRVHVQAAAGQKFPIEWASGHGYGSYTYFVALAASDESNMLQHTLASLEEYLANAPTPALQYQSDEQAMHSIPPPTPTGTLQASLVATPVTTTFWPGGRPTSFRQYCSGVSVYNKTSTATAQDKRASYTYAAMPWILAVWKFGLNEDEPAQMDMAFLEIPAGNPSGQYVIQYLWNGYYDCVDVNVLATTSTDVFGSPSNDTSLDKIDHCVFNMTLSGWGVRGGNAGCMEVKKGESIDGCLMVCANNNGATYSQCDGIQLSPVVMPSTAKFPGMFQGGTSHFPSTCDTSKMASDSLVCYEIAVGALPIVGPPFKVVSDPEDPVFYNTCYRKKGGWQFAQSCPACVPPVPQATNKFAQQCISCHDMYVNQAAWVAPTWVPATQCFPCDGTLG